MITARPLVKAAWFSNKNIMRKLSILSFLLLLSHLSFAQTQEQVLREIKRQNIPHPQIVLAQARHETGNFRSRLCKVNKNLFGMKKGKRYARYSHWKESVKDYKERISSRYQGGDYFTFLKRIGYAEDKKYQAKIQNIINTTRP